MKKKRSIILIVAILIILVALGLLGIYCYRILKNVKKNDIDKEDLSVNNDLLNDLNDALDNEVTEDEFDDIINFVLFGSDSRDISNMEAGRSDTIMIVSINTIKKNIKLISIPRDTYVEVPGYGKTKINHAYAYGQEALSIKTINTNFNLNLTEYTTIDFNGLVNVIDKVGGIELSLTPEEKRYIGINDERLQSSGKVLLNGTEALKHSRNRTIGNDFTRASRQRDVMEALLYKIFSLDMKDILGMSNDLLSQVTTNINTLKYATLLSEVYSNKSSYLSNIMSKQVPTQEYASDQMIDGIYYFVSDIEKAKLDLYNTIYGN